MTDILMTPSQVHTNLMISNPKYIGRGDYAIIFKINSVQKSNTKLSENIFEYIHTGNLKLDNILYAGKNPYGVLEKLSDDEKNKLINNQVDSRKGNICK